MSSKLPVLRKSRLAPQGRRNDSRHLRWRAARFEPLESRQLLAVGVFDPSVPGSLPDQHVTVAAGAPLYLALDVANVTGFNVASTQPGIATGAVLESLFNQSLQLTVKSDDNSINGVMTFQLFEQLVPDTVDRIIDLVNFEVNPGTMGPFYVDQTFLSQGGSPSGTGTGSSGLLLDDEFHPLLQHTSVGILSMSKTADDANDFQFFITAGADRNLDFNHTVFGFMTSGEAIRDLIESNSAVSIVDAQIIRDSSHAVLQLAAPANAVPGSTTVITVTAWDYVVNELGDPTRREVTQTYHVTIAADTENNRPFLGDIAPIVTAVNTPVTVNIPATDVEGDPINYVASYDTSVLNVTVNQSTGALTVTPKSGVVGVHSILVGVSNGITDAWDTQEVPVYVNPAAPTVQLTAESDTGPSNTDRITGLNNTSGKTLKFLVSGTVNGAKVFLYADGTLIGQGTATGSSVIIQTNGTFTLSNGAHAITAKQVLENRAVDVGNLHTSVNLASASSPALSITVAGDASQPDTVGLYAPELATFYLRYTNTSGIHDYYSHFGNPNFVPLKGDWDGDGDDTIGQFDPTTNTFWLQSTFTGSGMADIVVPAWPTPPAGEKIIPLAGDWDGVGGATTGYYVPRTAMFYLRNSNSPADTSYTTISYGNPGWLPLMGDWDGNGSMTVGLYAPELAYFFLKNTNQTGFADISANYGNPGWTPMIGDWDGNGSDTIGLYAPELAHFFFRNTNTSGIADVTVHFGNAGWLPMVGKWERVPQALMAESAVTPNADVVALTTADAQAMLSAAGERWQGGAALVALDDVLAKARIVVANLPDGMLGQAVGDTIYLDDDAAGHGWFIDSTPSLDEEFEPASAGALRAIDPRAVDRIDLLSVVEHELGHLAGLADLDDLDSVMGSLLAPGVRRTGR